MTLVFPFFKGLFSLRVVVTGSIFDNVLSVRVENTAVSTGGSAGVDRLFQLSRINYLVVSKLHTFSGSVMSSI